MLSQKSIDLIKSTVPILEKHGEDIIHTFYTKLFQDHPELLNIFNHTNFKNKSQPKALAYTLLQAAINIDNLESISSVVETIAEKHVSVGVKAEQYPIVGQYLLIAMQDFLKEAFTPELLQAWTEVYGYLADIFIKVEKAKYDKNSTSATSWEGFLRFKVFRKERESQNAVSFYISPEDGRIPPKFLPGQYISIKVAIPGEEHMHLRQYSLSNSPSDNYYRITVKLEQLVDGQQVNVSHYLHNNVDVGSIVEISMPAGCFVVDPTEVRPIVLLSGGIGITPLFSMLKSIHDNDKNRKVLFIHASINGDFYALREQVEAIVAENPNVKSFVCYQNPTPEDIRLQKYNKEGFLDYEYLKGILPKESCIYKVCGPEPFMKSIMLSLQKLGVDTNDIYYESFGPLLHL